MLETWVLPLGWEGPMEEGMVTHSSILAQRIPMNRGACRATQSMRLQRVGHDRVTQCPALTARNAVGLQQCDAELGWSQYWVWAVEASNSSLTAPRNSPANFIYLKKLCVFTVTD